MARTGETGHTEPLADAFAIAVRINLDDLYLVLRGGLALKYREESKQDHTFAEAKASPNCS